MKSTLLGAITLPSRALHSAISSSALTLWPGLSSTIAFTASPHFGSGTPMSTMVSAVFSGIL